LLHLTQGYVCESKFSIEVHANFIIVFTLHYLFKVIQYHQDDIKLENLLVIIVLALSSSVKTKFQIFHYIVPAVGSFNIKSWIFLTLNYI